MVQDMANSRVEEPTLRAAPMRTRGALFRPPHQFYLDMRHYRPLYWEMTDEELLKLASARNALEADAREALNEVLRARNLKPNSNSAYHAIEKLPGRYLPSSEWKKGRWQIVIVGGTLFLAAVVISIWAAQVLLRRIW